MEAAGVIDEVGAGLPEGLAIGQDVMAIVVPAGAHGAYAERIVVPAESVAPVPAGASHAEAATLPMNGLTALQAMDLLGLSPGQSLAVTGAAGSVGGYVIQLAKARGLRVIADASEADEALVGQLGADVVVQRGPDVAEHIRGEVDGGVDALVDAALQHQQVLPAVRDGGQVAAVRPFVGESERGITVHLVSVRTYARDQAKLDELRQLVEDGVLTLRVARVLPAEQAAEAHRQLAAGGTRGRLVLTF
jgi:NADPH:quinone reductase-like Zn-dependent oxidoreductase